MVWETAQLCS